MSKKLMALFLAAVLLLAAGCGKAENNPTDQQQQQDPIMKTYGDDFFLAQAKAMGYTDEMLATAKTMRFDPERLLACDGLGDEKVWSTHAPHGSDFPRIKD